MASLPSLVLGGVTALALSSLAAGPARADAVGQICDLAPAAGISIRRLDDEPFCGGFVVRNRTGAVVQRIPSARLGSGRILTSADGRVAVFIQTYPLARIDDQNRVRTLFDEPLVGVVVFRDGRELARIGIDLLVPDARGATETVSHVIWSEATDDVVGARFHIVTRPGLRFVIDTTTGNVRRA